MKILLLALLCCTPAIAQERKAPKTNIEFDCTCDDAIGRLYATEIRDLLANSPRFQQVDRVDPDKGTPGMRFVVLSLKDSHAEISVFSEVYLIGRNIYYNQSVQICPKERAQACARDAFTNIDEAVQNILAPK